MSVRPPEDGLTPGLSTLSGESSRQLGARLEDDQRARWQRGEQVAVEAYLEQHPQLGHYAEVVVDLIYNEFLLRREAGEAPTVEEYLQRFPHLARQLQDQWEVHSALDSGDALPPTILGEGGTPARDRPAPTAGELPAVPGYEVLEWLGKGGMGVVYKAWHLRLKRLVALKLLRDDPLADPQRLQRFLVEAEAVARLQHPHIVQIYEVGEHDGRPFLALEYVDGGSMAQKLKGTPLPAREAAQLVETLARTVHHAHQRGIIHRDLTPGNVLLTAEGTPKVTDFGLAKIVIGGEVQTQTGAILGTPSYMAPEQAGGKSREIGPAADVYALGAILYEMLTGRPPFRAETPLETALQVLSQEPVSPSRLQPKLPVDLVTICQKCLHKEPRRRYTSAEQLGERLRLFLEGRPIPDRPAGYSERAWRWYRRNPVLGTLGAAVVTLLLVLAIGSSIVAVRLREDRNRAVQAEQEAKNELAWSKLAQVRAGRWSGQPGRRLNGLKTLAEILELRRSSADPEKMPSLFELRNEAIASLALTDLRLAKQWDGCPTGTRSLDFDGTLEYYARWDGQVLSVRRVASDEEIDRLSAPGPGGAWPMFSRDGGSLAIAPEGRLSVWRWASPKARKVVDEWVGLAHAYDFSPDNRHFVSGHEDGSLSVYDLASDERLRRLAPGPRPTRLAIHPSEPSVAVSCGETVQIRDLEAGGVLAKLKHETNIHHIAWHPGGKTLAVAGNDCNIYLWDVPRRKQTLILKGHRNEGINLTFNHTGDLLASCDWSGVLRLWHPRTGKQIFSTPSGMATLRFSQDDRLLAAETNERKVGWWEVAPGHEYRTLIRDPVLGKGDYFGGDISADGRLLAVGMEDGTQLWDLTTGSDLGFVRSGRTSDVLFESPNALLTGGLAGLLRWPLQAAPGSAGTVRVGLPQKQHAGKFGPIARSRDGRVVATAEKDQGPLILNQDRPNQLLPLGPHEDVRQVAVSPDGRLVATGSHNGTGVKIWETQSRRLVKELLPLQHHCQARFSPDSKWLATAGGGCRLWEVGSWREGPEISGAHLQGLAFSPDSRVLAVETGKGVIRLVEPATGREYARLEDPNQDRAGWMIFSPDGGKLVFSTNDSQCVRVRDLGAIRRQLAAMGLDWDQ